MTTKYKKLLFILTMSALFITNTATPVTAKADETETTTETTTEVNEVIPSYEAFTEIEMIEQKNKNSAIFKLNYNLGNEIINNTETPALATKLVIPELNFEIELDNTNESEINFVLDNLENKTYEYYIESSTGQHYDGEFEVDFIIDEVVPVVTFTGIPNKKIFKGTKLVITMKTENTETEMFFNDKNISNGETGNSFNITITKNGNYKYTAKTETTKTTGVLKITCFKDTKVIMNVPLSYQRPKYPEGCESYATVAVLKYFKYKITENTFIKKYLDRINLYDKRVPHIKDLFDKYYLGDPSNKTQQDYLANPPVLINATNKYFKATKSSKYKPVNTTGVPIVKLLENEVLNNNPVVIWLTINNRNPVIAKVRGVPYIYPSHTIVISGYDRTTKKIHLTDSISGKRLVDYKTANKLYNKTGMKSFILRKENE